MECPIGLQHMRAIYDMVYNVLTVVDAARIPS